MTTRAHGGARSRNFAVFALFGHVGGAALLGLACLILFPPLALLAAFGGGALAGWLGIALGALVLSDGDVRAADSALPPRRPWIMIAAGAVASVVVCTASLVLISRGGFLDGSPCQELGGGRAMHMSTVVTVLPAQYTCVYSDGVLALVSPAALATLTLIALAGAAAIAYALWALRADAAESHTRYLAVPVAAFLALYGVLGVVALLVPAVAATPAAFPS